MISNGKVAFHTLGCKLNFAETSAIARSFNEAGYARVEVQEAPDVVVINTCSVTDNADKKCRNIVRRALSTNPDAFIAVIGCYAQLKPEEIANIEGVDLVLGANEKFNLLEHVGHLDKVDGTGVVKATAIKETKDFIPSYSSGDRTRTFLKVQDGCNYFCAFCTIPLARGRSRSANIERTVLQAKEAIAAGAKEIVLTGVNIGDFGTAHNEDLLGLIKELDQLEGVERYRISSIEPNLLNNEIIDFVAQSNHFVPHFHIPLQSGNDEILRAMRRRYLTDLYKDRIQRIKDKMPDACIGVDVITGFPGETDEHFNITYEFIQKLPVSYLHAFTYSERANTTALRIDEVIPMNIRQERTKMLRILSAKKKRVFYQNHLGDERPVLFEASEHDGLMFGFTDNYVKVELPFAKELINKVRDVKLGEMTPDGNVSASLLTTTAT